MTNREGREETDWIALEREEISKIFLKAVGVGDLRKGGTLREKCALDRTKTKPKEERVRVLEMKERNQSLPLGVQFDMGGDSVEERSKLEERCTDNKSIPQDRARREKKLVTRSAYPGLSARVNRLKGRRRKLLRGKRKPNQNGKS